MKHLLNEEEKKNFHLCMVGLFETFKANHGWNLTDQMEEIYLEGIVDFCDSLIFAKDQLTYDISTLRNEVSEYIDTQMEDEDES